MVKIEPTEVVQDSTTGLYKVPIDMEYSEDGIIVIYFEYEDDAKDLLKVVRRAVGMSF